MSRPHLLTQKNSRVYLIVFELVDFLECHAHQSAETFNRFGVTHKHGAEVQQHKHHMKNCLTKLSQQPELKIYRRPQSIYYRHIGLIDILGLTET